MAERELRVTFVGDDRQLQQAFGRVGASTSALEKRFGTAGAAAHRVGTQLGKLAKVGAFAGGAFAAAGTKAFVDFEGAMTSSTAIMDDVSKRLRGEMSDAAREVGRTTKFSATEAAESYFFLASAGMDAAETLKAMPIVSKFAQAGNFDLATATDLATDAQSALGLTVEKTAKNMRNLSKVQDVLVKANTLANATVEQFSEALTNKGAASLKVLSKDMEEGTAVLAAYADQGLKGAAAGTALSIVLRDLQKSALANEEAFEDAGVSVFNAQGEMRNIGVIIGELEDRFDGMSDKQKKAELTTLGFQEKSQQFLLTLLGSSDAIREYERELRDAGGTTERVADKQMEDLTGAVERLKGWFDEAKLSVGEGLAPTLEELADIISDPKLVSDQKFSQALDLIVEKLEELAPKAASAGGKVAGAFAQGSFRAFRDANPLGKLLIGVGLIRLLGGKGAIVASGAAAGRFLGIGIAGGAASAIGGGAAGRAAAGAAAGGIGGKIGGALKKIKWARFGGAAAGVGLAVTVMEGFERQFARSSEDVFKRLNQKLDDMGPTVIDRIFGESDMARISDDLRPMVEHIERLAESGSQISAGKFREFSDAINEIEFDPHLADDLRAALGVVGGPMADKVDRSSRRIRASYDRAFNLDDLARQHESNLSTIRANFGRSSEETQTLSERATRALAQHVADLAASGEISSAKARRWLRKLGVTTEGLVPKFSDMRSKARQHFAGAGRAARDLSVSFDQHFSGADEALNGLVGNAVKAQGKFRNTFQGVERKARQHFAGVIEAAREVGPTFRDVDEKARQHFAGAQGSMRGLNREMRQLRRDAKKHFAGTQEAVRTVIPTFRDVDQNAREHFGGVGESAERMKRLTSRQVRAMTTSARKSIGNLVTEIGRGLGILEGDTNKSLEALGLKAINFGTQSQRKAFAGAKRQRGGTLEVPGSGTGDTFRTALPSGSFVLNREASKEYFADGGMVPVALEPKERVFLPDDVDRFGLRNLRAMNETVKRFQDGGMVRPFGPAGGRGAVVNAAIAKEASAWMNRYGMLLTAGYNPGGGHQSPGHNVTGTALDTVPRAGWLDGPTRLFEQGLLAAIRGDKKVLYGTDGVGTPWPNHGRYDHAHTEWGMGGAVGALAQMIGRVMLKGPDGPLKDLGQEALDRVHRGANRYLSEQTVTLPVGAHGPAGGGIGKPALMNAWTQAGGPPGLANLAAAIAMAESRGVLNARNVNTDGSVDLGPWQINSVHGYPESQLLTLAGNAKAAVEVWRARRSFKPWVTFNEGLHTQFLQEGGLVGGTGLATLMQHGGLVGMQKGGLLSGPASKVLKRVLKRAGKPKRFRKATRKLRDAGIDTSMLTEMQERNLNALLERAETLEEWASRASALTSDHTVAEIMGDPDLRQRYVGQWGQSEVERILDDFDADDSLPLFGRFRGRSEPEWLQDALGEMFASRNGIIELQGQTEERLEQFRTQMQAQVERVGELMADARKRLRNTHRQLRQLHRRRRQFAGTRDRIQRIKPRKRTRQQRRKLREAQAELPRIRSRIDFFEARKEALANGGPVMTALTDRRRDITEHRDTTLTEFDSTQTSLGEMLERVQGIGSPTEVLAAIPPMGVLGGRIFDIQQQLQRLGAETRPPVSPERGVADDSAERIRLLEQKLAETQRFAAVSQIELASFGSLPAHHGGGVVTPDGMPSGTREVVRRLVPGEGVVDAETMRRGIAAPAAQPPEVNIAVAVQINGSIVRDPRDTRDPVEVFLGDRRVKAMIREEAARGAGRALTMPVRGRR